MHAHVCVCAADSALCFNFPADEAAVPARGQHRRLEARAGDGPSPHPLHLQLPGKSLSPPLLLFGLSAKRHAPRALGSSAVTSCLCGLLPAPGVGTDLALLPLCPIPAERCGDVPQGGEAREAGGNTGEQEGQRCLFTPGAAAEAWAPLLPSFSCTGMCICHQWKFPLGLPVPGLVSSLPGTTLHPGAGGCCCSR